MFGFSFITNRYIPTNNPRIDSINKIMVKGVEESKLMALCDGSASDAIFEIAAIAAAPPNSTITIRIIHRIKPIN